MGMEVQVELHLLKTCLLNLLLNEELRRNHITTLVALFNF